MKYRRNAEHRKMKLKVSSSNLLFIGIETAVTNMWNCILSLLFVFLTWDVLNRDHHISSALASFLSTKQHYTRFKKRCQRSNAKTCERGNIPCGYFSCFMGRSLSIATRSESSRMLSLKEHARDEPWRSYKTIVRNFLFTQCMTLRIQIFHAIAAFKRLLTQ